MDERDRLWDVVFDTYYDVYFEELAAENLSRRLGGLDNLTKFLVALTASGSAVAGWALWSSSGWRILWAILAGFAAILSILGATLKTPDRVRRLEEVKQCFCRPRVDLETLRDTMRLRSDFPIDETRSRWTELRDSYNTAMQRVQNDPLRSRRFLKKTQNELNERLADQIEGGTHS